MRQPSGNAEFRSDALGRQFAGAYGVLHEAIRARAFPGCAFGVLAGGETVLVDSLGRFTYDESAPTVKGHTVFDVASLTKVVATTAAAMLLFQRGGLDLETPLSALLPEFVAGRPAGDPARSVTIRHLLAHNSGLPGYVDFFRETRDARVLIQELLKTPLVTAPDARAEYSDPGFTLLGMALEAHLGEPLAQWLQREVYRPLGLTETGFCPPTEKRLAIPPTEEDTWLRNRRIQGEVQDENAWVLGGAAGHAGLFSNVPDLLGFAAEILDAWGKNGKLKLFQASTIEAFAKRQPPAGSPWALGWDTPSGQSSSGHHFSRNSIGHLGYSGCSLWIDLEASLAVVLLTNRTWPDRKSQLIKEVRPAFYDAVRESL
jgi:CubicO group peptidase (beta-lactamase class C family)